MDQRESTRYTIDAADLANGVIEAITNLQHEEELNYAKREIKILRPEFLAEFISSYTNLVR